MEDAILDSNLFKQENSKRRRSLFPWWIKTFIWIFLILGSIVPFGLIYGLLGYQFKISLYGFETSNPISIDGLYLSILFLLKGLTAFALWTEKDWAIILGKTDAIIGIILCGYMMIVQPFFNIQTGFHLNIRLELILLIPFLIKLDKIKDEWKKLAVADN
jgi:hypothetical protein